MKQALAIFATIIIAASSNATVIVNGVSGEDSDGNSPFETLQAALNKAIDTSDSLIQIETNDSIPGAWVGPTTALPDELTIQPGSGFTPILTTNLMLAPSNGSSCLVVLRNLTIRPISPQVDFPGTEMGPSARHTPLMVGCNLIAEDCNFGDTYEGPVGGAYPFGVSAALVTPDTVSSITLVRCHIRGHNGLAAGRSVKDYTAIDCLIEGIPTTFEAFYSGGVINHMNWAHDYTTRLAAPAFQEVSEPRTMTLDRCTVRAGCPIGWPGSTLPNVYYELENSVIGPFTATNSAFIGLDKEAPEGLNAYQFAYAATSNRLGLNQLPQNQNPDGTFTHCTFSSDNLSWGGDPADPDTGDPFVIPKRTMGGIRIESINEEIATVQFTNCLFDLPRADYGIGVNETGHTTATVVSGDGNVYRVLEDRAYVDLSNAPGSVNSVGDPYAGEDNEITPLPPFEATTVFEINTTFSDSRLSDEFGNLVNEALSDQATDRAVVTVPPTLVDKDNEIRPQPVSALQSDVGADEIGDTTSAVSTWSLY